MFERVFRLWTLGLHVFDIHLKMNKDSLKVLSCKELLVFLFI